MSIAFFFPIAIHQNSSKHQQIYKTSTSLPTLSLSQHSLVSESIKNIKNIPRQHMNTYIYILAIQSGINATGPSLPPNSHLPKKIKKNKINYNATNIYTINSLLSSESIKKNKTKHINILPIQSRTRANGHSPPPSLPPNCHPPIRRRPHRHRSGWILPLP